MIARTASVTSLSEENTASGKHEAVGWPPVWTGAFRRETKRNCSGLRERRENSTSPRRARMAKFSPHFNLGLTVSGDTEAARDPETFVFDPPDEVGYAAGVDFAVTPRFTVVGDIVGRTLRDTDRFDLRLTDVPTEFGATYREWSYRSRQSQAAAGLGGCEVQSGKPSADFVQRAFSAERPRTARRSDACRRIRVVVLNDACSAAQTAMVQIGRVSHGYDDPASSTLLQREYCRHRCWILGPAAVSKRDLPRGV